MNFEAKSVGRAEIDDDKVVAVDDRTLRRADFSGRTLLRFAAAGSRFEGCKFDRAKIQSGSFGEGRQQSQYVDCTFDHARIHFGPGGNARFVRCSFRDVDLRDWFAFAVELIDCQFTGRLRKAWFNGTVPEEDRDLFGRQQNEFRDNDFTGMNLVDVAFRTGIDLNAQRLPTGPKYLFLPNAPDAIRRARAVVIAWADAGRRETAMRLLRALEGEVWGGQLQLLLRRDTFVSFPRAVVNDVFELLGSAERRD